jgi:hypothetical protein
MITAYVTYDEGESTFNNLLSDGVGVDPSGALFLIIRRNERGGIQEGHIIANGCWQEVEIQEEPSED